MAAPLVDDRLSAAASCHRRRIRPAPIMGRMSDGQIQPGMVTAADLYGAVEATRREVGQILTKVEVMDDRHARIIGQVADHETRTRALEAAIPNRLIDRLVALEHWQWRAAGVVSVIAVLAGVLAGFMTALVAHHP